MIPLKCAHCGHDFEAAKSSYKASIWRGQTNFYCSSECVSNSQRVVLALTCSNCSAVFSRKPSQNKRAKNGFHFCGRKCAVIYLGAKRKQENDSREKTVKPNPACPECNTALVRNEKGRLRCFICLGPTLCRIGNKTKKELFASRTGYQSARSAIQKMARSVFFKAYPTPCCIAISNGKLCGYTKHIEVCHRKDVASFAEDALISEINDLGNMVGLCPTHHWEYDNNKLDVPLAEENEVAGDRLELSTSKV